jgi:hypothetical protein
MLTVGTNVETKCLAGFTRIFSSQTEQKSFIALTMETVRTSETSIYSETTGRYIPEGSNLQDRNRSQKVIFDRLPRKRNVKFQQDLNPLWTIRQTRTFRYQITDTFKVCITPLLKNSARFFVSMECII